MKMWLAGSPGDHSSHGVSAQVALMTNWMAINRGNQAWSCSALDSPGRRVLIGTDDARGDDRHDEDCNRQDQRLPQRLVAEIPTASEPTRQDSAQSGAVKRARVDNVRNEVELRLRTRTSAFFCMRSVDRTPRRCPFHFPASPETGAREGYRKTPKNCLE